MHNALVLGNMGEYRNTYNRENLDSLGYISAAESVVVSSTTFT